MSTLSTRTRFRFVEATLVAFGVYSLVLGLFMMVAPGTFFETLGEFGVRNDHYTFDNASFELPLGVLLLAALRWPSWRVPALSFATLHWALHSLSHIIDTDHGAGRAVGWLEAVTLVLATGVFAIALRLSIIGDRS